MRDIIKLKIMKYGERPMNYPGTTIEYTGLSGREFLNGTFIATSGLVMQQVCEISGLLTPTIQNWVTRGFIAHPISRKYDKNALARILLINSLRGALPLDAIKHILTFVNGSPENRADDIIPESELYSFVCDIAFDDRFASNTTDELIDRAIKDYNENIPGAKERLRTALHIIMNVFLAEKTLGEAKAAIDKLPHSNILGEVIDDK